MYMYMYTSINSAPESFAYELFNSWLICGKKKNASYLSLPRPPAILRGVATQWEKLDA